MAAGPFPAPLSPLAALCLRCAPDKFLLTKPNTFQHNPSQCRYAPMVFGIIPECRSAFLRNERSASPEYPQGSKNLVPTSLLSFQHGLDWQTLSVMQIPR